MPELPEVEVLVRHLAPLLRNKVIREVWVNRARTLAPTSMRHFRQKLRGARFLGLSRRGKYLLFELDRRGAAGMILVGHLGMTGRMYLLSATHPLPKHAAAVFKLGAHQFVFEDTRYFGRLTFDSRSLQRLGPEPLDKQFTSETLFNALKNCRQPIKVALLDQSRVAGLGNIYAGEALFRAKLSPRIRARKLTRDQIDRLWKAIRDVLSEAIERGSTIPLDYAGLGERDGLFYFGRAPGVTNSREERLSVYDRAGKPCLECGTTIKRLVQAARSTFYCPTCQKNERSR